MVTLVSFRFGARSKSGKVKPGRQRGATVAVGDYRGRMVVQEWNRCNRPVYIYGRNIPGVNEA